MALVQSSSMDAGWEAVDFHLPDVEGRDWSLDDFNEYQGLLVVFTCNHCPYAKAAWPLLVELHEEFGEDIGFVAINPNDTSVVPEDGVDGMKKVVSEYEVEFPYLRDESQSTAHDYDAQCTPDVYLFVKSSAHLDGFAKARGIQSDVGWELFYRGRINDNWQNLDEVTEHSLHEAMTKLMNHEEMDDQWNPSMGCSIKWK